MSVRGAIRNRELATQLRDFTGLRFGAITPTDIDGFLEFGDRLFIVFETKHAGRDLPKGQRLAIERLIDAIAESGCEAIALIGEHDTQGDIDFANCPMREYRYQGKWRRPKTPTTFKQAVDYMRSKT